MCFIEHKMTLDNYDKSRLSPDECSRLPLTPLLSVVSSVLTVLYPSCSYGVTGIFLSNASYPAFLQTSLQHSPLLVSASPFPSYWSHTTAYECAVRLLLFIKPSLHSYPSPTAFSLLSSPTTRLLERIVYNESPRPFLSFALKSVPCRLSSTPLHCTHSCPPPEGPSSCSVL